MSHPRCKKGYRYCKYSKRCVAKSNRRRVKRCTRKHRQCANRRCYTVSRKKRSRKA